MYRIQDNKNTCPRNAYGMRVLFTMKKDLVHEILRTIIVAFLCWIAESSVRRRVLREFWRVLGTRT